MSMLNSGTLAINKNEYPDLFGEVAINLEMQNAYDTEKSRVLESMPFKFGR